MPHGVASRAATVPMTRGGPLASVAVGDEEPDGVRDDGAGDATVGSGPREEVLNGPVSCSPPQPARSTIGPEQRGQASHPDTVASAR